MVILKETNMSKIESIIEAECYDVELNGDEWTLRKEDVAVIAKNIKEMLIQEIKDYAEPESTIETLEKYITVQSFEDYLAYKSWLVYVDMYKEYNGIRPRGTSWSDHTSEEWMSIVENL